MLRRLVPLTLLAAAAVVAVPATASASSPNAAVDVVVNTSFSASGEVQTSEGTVSVSLNRYRTAPGGWGGYVYVDFQRPCSVSACSAPVVGYADLTGVQVRFDRNLDTASVQDLPLTISTDAGMRTVTASIVFTATGPVTASQSRQDVCGSGDPCPTSVRHDQFRAATLRLTVDGTTTEGAGSLAADHGTDVYPATAY